MISTERFIEVPVVRNSNIIERISVPESLKILKDNEKASEYHGMFRLLTPKDGDKRVVWDCREMQQIEDAKVMFDACVAKGLVPYRVGINGKRTSDVMDEFDPEAEEVIFLPVSQIVGG